MPKGTKPKKVKKSKPLPYTDPLAKTEYKPSAPPVEIVLQKY